MVILKKHQLKGSTLVEVLISMVIISATFITSGMIFMNVLSGSGSLHEVKVNAELERIKIETITESKYYNDKIVTPYGVIEKKITSKNEDLFELTLNAVDTLNGISIQRKFLILNEEN